MSISLRMQNQLASAVVIKGDTMSSTLTIYNQKIKPGEAKVIMIPMPQLYDSTPLMMPVHVIRGKKSGPILSLTAAIHGDEINGIEIIRRILKKKLLNRLSGTIIAIPIVNMYGFLYQDRYLIDRRDLNRFFPGSQRGSLASRLAYIISHEIIDKCTHCIDLHTGSLHRSNLPQIRTNLDNPKTKKLAKSFNAPITLHAKLRDGSLRSYASQKNIPFLLYESGEALRFDEFSIKVGVKGILNVMRTLKMIKSTADVAVSSSPLSFARSSYWVRAQHSGIIQAKQQLGALVQKGTLLAKIGDPMYTTEYKVTAPIGGIIIGKNNLPMIHEGAAIFHIASFKNIDLVSEKIEGIQEFFDESM